MCPPAASGLPIQPVHLRNGRQVWLRQVRVADAGILQDFVRSLSPQSRRKRFFSTLTELPPYMLERLTRPHRPDEVGLLALAADGASCQVVGMAQYALEAPRCAELGVVVADAWQRQGLATRLIRALGEYALLTGVRTLCALTLADNRAMLGLMHRLDWTMLGFPEPGVLRFEGAATTG